MKRIIKVKVRSCRDGRTEVSSDDLPGLILSGDNRPGILAAIEPAARALLERKGQIVENIQIDAVMEGNRGE